MSLQQLDDIIGKVDRSIEALERNLPDHIRRAALNSKELIDSRITNLGLNAQGAKILNQFTGNVYSIDYAKYKKSRGRQVAFVDLQDTGDMWRNIGTLEIIRSIEGGYAFKVSIGARNEENQKKLDDNALRYGPILDLSDEENEEVTQILLQNVINDIEFI